MEQTAKVAVGRQITLAQWDILMTSFREMAPPAMGAITQAATAAGVARKTARHAFDLGTHYLGKEPIRDLLIQEKAAARAGAMEVTKAALKEQTQAQADRAYQEAEKARMDLIKSRRQEGDMVRAERGNLVALIGITGTTLRGGIKMAREIERALETGEDPATGKKLTLREKVDMLWKVSRIVAQTATASAEVIRMERLLLGEPTEIIGMTDLGDITEEQAIADIKEANEAANRILERRARGLRLVGA